MSADRARQPRDAILPSIDQTYAMPNWVDGVVPDLGPRVMVVREVSNTSDCAAAATAVFTEGLTVRKMLYDYIQLRAFTKPEMQVALTYQVVDHGKAVEPAVRSIGDHKGGRTTLRRVTREYDWIRALRTTD